MTPPTVLKNLRIENLLSFGATSPAIPLGRLNALIGPNASGKSNLVEVIGLLNSAPKDLAEPIREGGGIGEWLWKGSDKGRASAVEALVSLPQQGTAIRYMLSLRRARTEYQFEVADERIENESSAEGKTKPYIYFAYENGRPMLNVKDGKQPGSKNTNWVSFGIKVRSGELPGEYPDLCRVIPNQHRNTPTYSDWAGADLSVQVCALGANMPARVADLNRKVCASQWSWARYFETELPTWRTTPRKLFILIEVRFLASLLSLFAFSLLFQRGRCHQRRPNRILWLKRVKRDWLAVSWVLVFFFGHSCHSGRRRFKY
jgi:energy-coupling factor transporter ATP-binding protein EcfA2